MNEEICVCVRVRVSVYVHVCENTCMFLGARLDNTARKFTLMHQSLRTRKNLRQRTYVKYVHLHILEVYTHNKYI